MLWDDKLHVAVLADFTHSSRVGESFIKSTFTNCDYETDKQQMGNQLNDIWNLGLTIAEMELGTENINLANHESSGNMFTKIWRSDRKQQVMDLRLITMRGIIAKDYGMNQAGSLGFAGLMQAMLRIQQKNRIQSFSAVIEWLQVLQTSYKPNSVDIEELKRSFQEKNIGKSLPNVKSLKDIIKIQ